MCVTFRRYWELRKFSFKRAFGFPVKPYNSTISMASVNHTSTIKVYFDLKIKTDATVILVILVVLFLSKHSLVKLNFRGAQADLEVCLP